MTAIGSPGRLTCECDHGKVRRLITLDQGGYTICVWCLGVCVEEHPKGVVPSK